MQDRSTKVLMALIAAGLFANALIIVLKPEPVTAQCYGLSTTELSEVGACLDDIHSSISDLESQLSNIESNASDAATYARKIYRSLP